jgi:hypothetical protein
MPPPCPPCPHSYYQLGPEEEALLRAVARRDDAALERDNPFDLSLQVGEPAGAPCWGAGPGPLAPAGGARTTESSVGRGRSARRVSGAGSDDGASTPARFGPGHAGSGSMAAGGQGAAPATPAASDGQLDDAAEGWAWGPSSSVDGADSDSSRGPPPPVDAAVAARHLRARLAEVDARLAEYAACHTWDEAGSLADFRGTTPAKSSAAVAAGGGAPSAGPAAAPEDGSSCSGGSNVGGAGSVSSAPGARGSEHSDGASKAAAPSSAASAAATTAGQEDYLRLTRERRERDAREREVDRALRALRADSGADAAPLAPGRLQALLEECLRQRAVEEEWRAAAAAAAVWRYGSESSGGGSKSGRAGLRVPRTSGARRAAQPSSGLAA